MFSQLARNICPDNWTEGLKKWLVVRKFIFTTRFKCFTWGKKGEKNFFFQRLITVLPPHILIFFASTISILSSECTFNIPVISFLSVPFKQIVFMISIFKLCILSLFKLEPAYKNIYWTHWHLKAYHLQSHYLHLENM